MKKQQKKASLFAEIAAKEAATINGGCAPGGKSMCLHARQNFKWLGLA
jgi:hypothetical protein